MTNGCLSFEGDIELNQTLEFVKTWESCGVSKKFCGGGGRIGDMMH